MSCYRGSFTTSSLNDEMKGVDFICAAGLQDISTLFVSCKHFRGPLCWIFLDSEIRFDQFALDCSQHTILRDAFMRHIHRSWGYMIRSTSPTNYLQTSLIAIFSYKSPSAGLVDCNRNRCGIWFRYHWNAETVEEMWVSIRSSLIVF